MRFFLNHSDSKALKFGQKKPAREGRLTTFIAMLRIEVYVEAYLAAISKTNIQNFFLPAIGLNSNFKSML